VGAVQQRGAQGKERLMRMKKTPEKKPKQEKKPAKLQLQQHTASAPPAPAPLIPQPQPSPPPDAQPAYGQAAPNQQMQPSPPPDAQPAYGQAAPNQQMQPSPPPAAQHGFFASLANNKWVANPIRLFFTLAIIWLAAMFFISVVSPSPTWGYEYDEGPLAKAPFQIQEGEEYTYYFGTPDNASFVHIATSKSSICPGGLLMYDKSFAYTQNIKYASVCVDDGGMQLSEDGNRIGSNVSYEGVAWPFFAPWMLAVNDGWNWSVNSTFIAGPYRTFSKTYLRFVENGTKDYLGRQGWQVEMYASDHPQGNFTKIGRSLVDKQKRIALFSDYFGVQAWLSDAPFPLIGNASEPDGNATNSSS